MTCLCGSHGVWVKVTQTPRRANAPALLTTRPEQEVLMAGQSITSTFTATQRARLSGRSADVRPLGGNSRAAGAAATGGA